MPIWWLIIALVVYAIMLFPTITLVIIQKDRIRALQRDLERCKDLKPRAGAHAREASSE